MRAILIGLVGLTMAIAVAGRAAAADPAAIERGLDLVGPGVRVADVGLAEAMAILKVPSVSVAVIDGGRLDWARAPGAAASRRARSTRRRRCRSSSRPSPPQEGRLALDADVDGGLGAWRLPASPLTAGHPVTLRWLLSMRGGVGPQHLLLQPCAMIDSRFAQPLPASLAVAAARGHRGDGAELPGGWRVMPGLAAAGLWSTAADLARLLVEIGRAWRGEPGAILDRRMARAMLTPQGGGPYGLGGTVAGEGGGLVLMKRGQNIGYQGYLTLFPAPGQGIVVMANSDNGTTLAEAIIRRAAIAYGWPTLPPFGD